MRITTVPLARGRRRAIAFIAAIVAAVGFQPIDSDAQTALPGTWTTFASAPAARTEASYVFSTVDDKFHLIGGALTHKVYDPATNSWGDAPGLPIKIHHVQAVEVGGKIYFIGGLTAWPSPHVSTVYIYDVATKTWSQGAPMPRGRGAGGVAVYQGDIYYAGGLNNGVAVPWFDRYDPQTNAWTQLPNMPVAREHFHGAVLDGMFWAVGGRNVNINNFVTQTVAFNFSSGQWETGFAPIPTPRGGFGTGVLNGEVIVFGGEGGGQAFDRVEAYNPSTNSWRQLAPMLVGKHGIQAAECNGGIYIATGSLDQGGGSATASQEAFWLGAPTSCGGSPSPPPPSSIGFGKSTLQGAQLVQPTSLQFGPDGRLYVAQFNGIIKVFSVVRNGPNSYSVTATQTINAVQGIPNHNDDGSLNTAQTKRLVTGLVVTGTPSNPVIYVSSSDPRIGGGAEGQDLNLDTNSGTISRLSWNGSSWVHTVLVRGLPRSEENHGPNGMALSGNTLYLAQGGNTNKGATSHNFALLPEYGLSAAILSIDLAAIASPPYDIPTLNDETRPGNPDADDPFGGNDGLNQAKVVPGGPVQVFASGFRNPYDVAITQAGRMYTSDNGPNAGWGDVPINEGPAGTCTNGVNEPGTSSPDALHLVTPGYYGGHPNPTRANPNNKFNASNPQSPVTTAHAIECDYRGPSDNGSLTTLSASSNGIDEYTTDNFGGAMQGDLVLAGYVKNEVQRVELNASGGFVAKSVLFSTVGTHPLDITALGQSDPFPGVIFVADIASDSIYAFEPNDFGGGTPSCTGADDPVLDEDEDGFDNADEIDNGTDPCSSADVPHDWDGDLTSDLNDTDDDNDGSPDTSDPFAIDAQNGSVASIPVEYSWENNDPPAGSLLNAGFTGLMTNGTANYASLFDEDNMTVGGAAGVLTVDEVPAGDAYKLSNTQKYGLQFGVLPATSTFTAHTRLVAPFSGLTPQASQSMGLFIGDGTQSNYFKIVVRGNNGGGIQRIKEIGDTTSGNTVVGVSLPGPDSIDLFLTVNPSNGSVRASYQITSGGVAGPRLNLGSAVGIPARWFDGSEALAVGIISTSKGPGPVFPATWDFVRVYAGT